MLRKLILKLLKNVQGKSCNQNFLEEVHNLALIGMNYGEGSFVASSGEKLVLKMIAELPGISEIIVFDVGANIGEYSLEVYNLFRDSVKIYAFEPLSSAFDDLKENLKEKRAQTYNFGFAEFEETRTLYFDTEASGLASLYKRRLNHFNLEMNMQEKVKLRRIDDFCKENRIDKINLLKIDVEGHEFNVLRGAGEMLKFGAIDLIQFEFGGCNIDSRTFFQDFFYLLNPNYRIFRILQEDLIEISKYKETYEIFITTNYLAVSRKLDL